MSVVLYGVVHDHVESVFGLCKQLTGYGFFSEIFEKNIAVFRASHNISRDFKIMLAV